MPTRSVRAAPSMVRNLRLNGRRTTVRLEPVMWDALVDIAKRQNRRSSALIAEIERGRVALGLTAAIRVYVVEHYRALATAGDALSLDKPDRDKPD